MATVRTKPTQEKAPEKDSLLSPSKPPANATMPSSKQPEPANATMPSSKPSNAASSYKPEKPSDNNFTRVKHLYTSTTYEIEKDDKTEYKYVVLQVKQKGKMVKIIARLKSESSDDMKLTQERLLKDFDVDYSSINAKLEQRVKMWLIGKNDTGLTYTELLNSNHMELGVTSGNYTKLLIRADWELSKE